MLSYFEPEPTYWLDGVHRMFTFGTRMMASVFFSASAPPMYARVSPPASFSAALTSGGASNTVSSVPVTPSFVSSAGTGAPPTPSSEPV